MSQESTNSPKPRRGATATRGAILEAARTLFTQSGYEQVGVRDIASVAGVDPALVIRYFGSKEGLFSEAITQQFDMGLLLAGERARFGKRMARYILHKAQTAGPGDPLLALLRSAPHEQGPLRAAISGQFVQPLAAWLGGEGALLRANLITAYLLGIVVTSDLIQNEPLAEDEVNARVALIAPVLQFYVEGRLTEVSLRQLSTDIGRNEA